jgi:hypothetical protein
MLTTIFHVLALAAALLRLPEMTPARARDVAVMAVSMETVRAPAELLASLAWAESRGDGTVVTGRTCGVLQVNPEDLGLPWAATCARWARTPLAGMRGGVIEIEMMLRDGRVHGDLHRALLYRACGNAAFDPASDCVTKKAPWVQHALERAQFLRGSSSKHAPGA